MRMKKPLPMKTLFRLFSVLLLAAFCASCSSKHKLQTVLGADEQIEEGSPVTMNGKAVGQVLSVGEEGGDRVADFMIEDEAAMSQAREGLYRTKTENEIALKTDLIKEGAPPLARGARVPVRGAFSVVIEKYGRGSTLLVVAGGVVVLLLVWLVFRSLVGTAMLVICAVLAGVGAQLATPYATPYTKNWLDGLGPPPIPVEEMVEPTATEMADGEKKDGILEWMDMGEGALVKIASRKPSPFVVTWSIVFLVSFFVLNLMLARVSRGWRKAT